MLKICPDADFVEHRGSTTMSVQKIATKIFICASIAFGVVGLILVLFGGPNDNTQPNITLMRLLLATVFVILPSFALSVAGKYLNGK